jgi:hypothetical protein
MQKIVLAFVLVGILSLGAVGAGLGAGMLSVSSQSQSETLVPQIYFVEAQDIINKTGLFSPQTFVRAFCDLGDVVIGGGYELIFPFDVNSPGAVETTRRIVIVENHPINESGVQGWLTSALSSSLGNTILKVTAICLIQHEPAIANGGPPFGPPAQGQGP